MTMLIVALVFTALALTGYFFGADSRHGPEWRWGEAAGPYRGRRW